MHLFNSLKTKIMKLFNLKSGIGLLSLGILCFLFAPSTSVAQNRKYKKANTNNKRNKGKATKVITRRNNVRRAQYVNTISRRSSVLNYRNNRYYYNNGLFYRPSNGRYLNCAAPVGLRVRTLAPNPYRFNYRGRNVYYSNGTFYNPTIDNEYEVIGAPIGARIDYLPEGYEIVELDTGIYFRVDDTYYKEVVERNGGVVYEVVNA
jgi:hypothetical protein